MALYNGWMFEPNMTWTTSKQGRRCNFTGGVQAEDNITPRVRLDIARCRGVLLVSLQREHHGPGLCDEKISMPCRTLQSYLERKEEKKKSDEASDSKLRSCSLLRERSVSSYHNI